MKSGEKKGAERWTGDLCGIFIIEGDWTDSGLEILAIDVLDGDPFLDEEWVRSSMPFYPQKPTSWEAFFFVTEGVLHDPQDPYVW